MGEHWNDGKAGRGRSFANAAAPAGPDANGGDGTVEFGWQWDVVNESKTNKKFSSSI